MARSAAQPAPRPGLALLALLLVAAGFPVLVVAAQPLQYAAGSRGGPTFLDLGRPSE